MIEQGLGYYAVVTMVLIILLAASNLIPLFGFIRKRWKGLAIGCLLQPIVCGLVCLLTVIGVYFHQNYEFRKYKESAMVTVKKVDDKGNAHIWHMKPDEECFYECREVNSYNNFLFVNKAKLYDVVPLDSFAVCVDDKIFVRFDMKNRKASATEYDEPIEVASVNWDRVSDFFKKHP